MITAKMSKDKDEWTDDDEMNQDLVKKINRIPLSELKDMISSKAPSFSFTAKNGYLLVQRADAKIRRTYPLSLYNTKTIPTGVFQECFKLIESNLKHLYAQPEGSM